MPDKGYVYYRTGIKTAERDHLLNQMGGGKTAVIHHTTNRIQFESWPPAVAVAPHGQLFNQEVEVRWQPVEDSDAYELLVLSEQKRPNLLQSGWVCQEMETELTTIYLWGKHWQAQTGATSGTANGWVQAEIEADLSYPVIGNKNQPMVQVGAVTYRRGGLPCFTRFTHVYPVKDEEGG